MMTQTKLSPASASKPGHFLHEPLFGCPELVGVAMPYDRNAEIYGEDEPCDYVYKVLRGAVRTYKILADGRRQIIGFYLAGDVFGLDCDESYSCSAEAITASQLLLVRRAAVLNLAQREGNVARSLWRLTSAELKRSQDHGLLLIKSAQERLAAFLLDMAKRLSSKNEVDLPMSRQDIADHLGLTIETVSRTFTQLAESAVIQFLASRRIVLRDRACLSEMNA